MQRINKVIATVCIVLLAGAGWYFILQSYVLNKSHPSYQPSEYRPVSAGGTALDQEPPPTPPPLLDFDTTNTNRGPEGDRVKLRLVVNVPTGHKFSGGEVFTARILASPWTGDRQTNMLHIEELRFPIRYNPTYLKIGLKPDDQSNLDLKDLDPTCSEFFELVEPQAEDRLASNSFDSFYVNLKFKRPAGSEYALNPTKGIQLQPNQCVGEVKFQVKRVSGIESLPSPDIRSQISIPNVARAIGVNGLGPEDGTGEIDINQHTSPDGWILKSSDPTGQVLGSFALGYRLKATQGSNDESGWPTVTSTPTQSPTTAPTHTPTITTTPRPTTTTTLTPTTTSTPTRTPSPTATPVITACGSESTFATANTTIQNGGTIYGTICTAVEKDIYQILIPDPVGTLKSFQATLIAPTEKDYDIAFYLSNESTLRDDLGNGGTKTLQTTLRAGTYYLEIKSGGSTDFSSTDPYTLTVAITNSTCFGEGPYVCTNSTVGDKIYSVTTAVNWAQCIAWCNEPGHKHATNTRLCQFNENIKVATLNCWVKDPTSRIGGVGNCNWDYGINTGPNTQCIPPSSTTMGDGVVAGAQSERVQYLAQRANPSTPTPTPYFVDIPENASMWPLLFIDGVGDLIYNLPIDFDKPQVQDDGPDLTVSEMKLFTDPRLPDQCDISLDVKIKNIGLTRITPQDAFRLAVNGEYKDIWGPFAPGEEKTFNFKTYMHGTIMGPNVAQVDSAQTISELREDNNTLFRFLFIGSLAQEKPICGRIPLPTIPPQYYPTSPISPGGPTSTPGVPEIPLDMSKVNLKIKAKLQGIRSDTFSRQYSHVKFGISIGGGALTENTEFVKSDFIHRGGGVYEGIVTFNPTGIPSANNYKLIVKGPRHIAKRFCIPMAAGDEYYCPGNGGAVALGPGLQRFDFSTVGLAPGDTAIGGTQDGVIDSSDLTYIRDNLSKKEAEVLRAADLNFDGIIDTQDFLLVINNLINNEDEK